MRILRPAARTKKAKSVPPTHTHTHSMQHRSLCAMTYNRRMLEKLEPPVCAFFLCRFAPNLYCCFFSPTKPSTLKPSKWPRVSMGFPFLMTLVGYFALVYIHTPGYRECGASASPLGVTSYNSSVPNSNLRHRTERVASVGFILFGWLAWLG